DVFAPGFLSLGDRLGEWGFVAHLGKFDQHGQVDAGEHLDLRSVHHRDRQVRRGAAEHVGQDRDAVTAVHPFDCFNDVVASAFHVVVRPDRYRFDLLLLPHHVFERGTELDGEPPVGNEDDAYHEATPTTPRG